MCGTWLVQSAEQIIRRLAG